MVDGVLPDGPSLGLGLLVVAFLVSVAAFWSAPRRLRDAVLASTSFGVLVLMDPRSLLSLLLLAVVVHALAPRAVGRWRGGLLLLLILAVLGHLAIYKYVPPLLRGGGALDLVVPLGISYYTFKLIHYAVEVARGTIVDRRLWTFLAYLFLLPTFTAGPIERFDHFLESRETRFSADALVEGGNRIVLGLVKKFVLAVNLGTLLDRLGGGAYLVENLATISPWRVWGTCVLMYLYVYMDFSAYTDLAIGGSRLFGIRIMENFHWPILARDIGQYWLRWHMTLAGWCRTYVYMPALGVIRSPYVAVYATFLAIGLWHAGSLSYAAWGLYHATGVAVFQTWRRLRRQRKWTFSDRLPWRLLAWPATFLFVSASFAFTLSHAHGGAGAGVRILARLVGIVLPG